MATCKTLVLLLALCVAAQSAKVPQPKVGVDLDTISENVMEIMKTIMKHLNEGITAVGPNIDAIQGQLPVEVADAVEEVTTSLKGIVTNIEERVDIMMTEVKDAFTQLVPSQVCSDPISEQADGILTDLENGILGAVRASQETNKEGLQSVHDGVIRIVDNVRNVFDDSLARLVKCLLPGSVGARDCVKQVYADLSTALAGIGADLLLLISETGDVLKPFGEGIMNVTKPMMTTAVEKAGPLMQEVSDCLATLA